MAGATSSSSSNRTCPRGRGDGQDVFREDDRSWVEIGGEDFGEGERFRGRLSRRCGSSRHGIWLTSGERCAVPNGGGFGWCAVSGVGVDMTEITKETHLERRRGWPYQRLRGKGKPRCASGVVAVERRGSEWARATYIPLAR